MLFFRATAMNDPSRYAEDEERIHRRRRTPADADVKRIWEELKEIEHLLAIAKNDHGPRGKSAKRQASARRFRLAFDLESYFPVPLPDGRIVTSGSVTEGKNKGNYGLIFGSKK